MREILYGRQAVRESLRAKRRPLYKLLLAEKVEPAPILQEIQTLAQAAKIPTQKVARQELEQLSNRHQGVALEVGPYPTVDPADIVAHAAAQGEPPFIVVLDHLEDPHNVGAIIRTAEIVGAHGLLLPKRRAVGVTPAVVNASAGATEWLRVAPVANLTQALNKLKAQGVWVAGVERGPKAVPHHQANLSGPLALVIGSEGQGISRLVRETCDFLVALPMRGRIESLNASVAGGVVLYEVWRARGY
jgi:23S rRNA (guanosine2251-2'-O)-methyltransferase